MHHHNSYKISMKTFTVYTVSDVASGALKQLLIIIAVLEISGNNVLLFLYSCSSVILSSARSGFVCLLPCSPSPCSPACVASESEEGK
jgi:hypothetical protein